MQEFDQLVGIIERLMAPDGCPWDREQTMKSIRSNILEEAAELIDAIDSEDNTHICEELGDVFFVLVFLCKLAEKEQRCTMIEALQEANAKLVRRHPHVFGDVEIKDSEAVLKQWAEIKQQEKGKAERTSVLDGIPHALPSLARAQKISKKIRKTEFAESFQPVGESCSHSQGKSSMSGKSVFESEAQLGKHLLEIVWTAQEKGLDAEQALRQALVQQESAFRAVEAAARGAAKHKKP